MPPAVVTAVSLGVSAVGAVGGLIQGNRQQKQNEAIQADQQKNLQEVMRLARQMSGSVQESEYMQRAARDVAATQGVVDQAMMGRGLGRGSTAGLTAVAEAAARIRGQYGNQFLQDRQQATATAASMISGVATTPRLGYDADPYSGFRSGMGGISSWAANYGDQVAKGNDPWAWTPKK